MTAPTDKGAPGEGGPYCVRATIDGCLIDREGRVGENLAMLRIAGSMDRLADDVCVQLNAAHTLGFEAGARAAEQAAAGTIAQLNAALAPARERIEQLEAEQRALLARIAHMQAALEAKLGEEMEP